jgi:NAD+ kinase
LKKQTDNLRRIGLVSNADKPEAARTVRKAAKMITARGGKVLALESTARQAKLEVPTFPDLKSLRHAVDLLLVFGGDGTMLGVAREAAGSPTPILGINIGGLGFLTAVSSSGMGRALDHLWAKNYRFESRALLEAEAHCGKKQIQLLALNDFVIGRMHVSRLIELEVAVDGEPVTRYRCDGLIFSSPTGSTAYSLAAGGAVVHPTAKVLALTPISPHTLSNRSLILPSTSVVHVTSCNPPGSTLLSADGQTTTELEPGDTVVIRQSRRSVRLVHLAGSSFFEALRHKLHWRGAYL